MNKIHETSYKIFNEKVNGNFKVVIISDLHFSYKIDNNYLYKLYCYLKYINPDYILIPGDLIDSINMIEDSKEKERLLRWIQKLSFTKVIISLASHDFCKKNLSENSTSKWEYCYDEKLFEDINNIKNTLVLDNDSFSDNNLYVVGLTQPWEYYNPSEPKDTSCECKEELVNLLNTFRNDLIHNLPNDKVNLSMIHSPVYLKDDDIEEILKEFDYYISGHMHNGCVPPILYELWKSSRGLITPDKHFFRKNERNTFLTKDDKLIVCGPLTMFQECTGIIQKFNFLYPTYTTLLDFTENSEYDKPKIYTKRKYLSM